MRDIRFSYLYDTGEGICECIYSLECLENTNFPDSDYKSYKIIAKRQYTGLKDKNGVEIYEGDILSNDNAPPRYVMFEDGSFRFQDEGNQCNQALVPFTCSKLLIIGNIYEHSELIEIATN